MNTHAIVWFTIASSVLFIVVTEPEVLDWLSLVSRLVVLWFQRQWFLFRHNPNSPWVRWAIHRNASRLANELIKEHQNK